MISDIHYQRLTSKFVHGWDRNTHIHICDFCSHGYICTQKPMGMAMHIICVYTGIHECDIICHVILTYISVFFSNGTLGRVEFYVQINTIYSVYLPKRHMIKFTAFHVDITGQVCHRTNIWWLVNCMEMHLKMLPAKCWPFSLGLNVLIDVCKMSFVSSTPLFQKRWFYLTWLFYNMLNLFILYVG